MKAVTLLLSELFCINGRDEMKRNENSLCRANGCQTDCHQQQAT